MSAITPIVKCWHTFPGMFTWEIGYHADVSVVSYWGHIEVSLTMCRLIVQWVIEYEDIWCFLQAEVCESVFQWRSPSASSYPEAAGTINRICDKQEWKHVEHEC